MCMRLWGKSGTRSCAYDPPRSSGQPAAVRPAQAAQSSAEDSTQSRRHPPSGRAFDPSLCRVLTQAHIVRARSAALPSEADIESIKLQPDSRSCLVPHQIAHISPIASSPEFCSPAYSRYGGLYSGLWPSPLLLAAAIDRTSIVVDDHIIFRPSAHSHRPSQSCPFPRPSSTKPSRSSRVCPRTAPSSRRRKTSFTFTNITNKVGARCINGRNATDCARSYCWRCKHFPPGHA